MPFGPGLDYPEGSSDIWNSSMTWVNFTFWHPAGVISNVNSGKVVWANVNFLSISTLCYLSMVAYPGIIIPVFTLLGICVSLSLGKEQGQQQQHSDTPPEARPPRGPPALLVRDLAPWSQRAYGIWKILCCLLPAILVFGTPLALVVLSYPWPQEVFVLTLVVSSAFVFSNGVYMVFFVPQLVTKMQKAMAGSSSTLRDSSSRPPGVDCIHWVILPNFKEPQHVLDDAIRSIAASSLAKTNICILLAMEEREGAAGQEKADALLRAHASTFREMQVSTHPRDLPNDPPGKASNMSFAYLWLMEHLRRSSQDISKVVLTVADADSMFHQCYFEALLDEFSAMEPEQRYNTLWQAPVFHVQNYHRQPGPVIVGTLFTAMSEIAFLSDPNAIRFPYSTYSLTAQLAQSVGGWDADWIAEDWHMGIKCFLLTFGKSQVKPIMVPTVNYAPEGDEDSATWSHWKGCVWMRWAQAKRHALGFSDLSYYFMMLPLIFVYVTTNKQGHAQLSDFWRLIVNGVPYIVRLINTHVVLGVLTFYFFLDLGLKKAMMILLGELRGINDLFDRIFFASTTFFVSSMLLMSIVTLMYQSVYKLIRLRLDPPEERWKWLYENSLAHFFYTVLCFITWGPFYFTGLAIAVWTAAAKMIFSHTFVYEVAAKPTKAAQTAAEKAASISC